MHFDYCQHFVFILQLLPAEHQSHLRSTSKIVDLKRNFFYCICARCACIIEAWTAKNRVDSNFILLFVCYIERVSVSFINVKFPRNQHNDTHNASIDAHTHTHSQCAPNRISMRVTCFTQLNRATTSCQRRTATRRRESATAKDRMCDDKTHVTREIWFRIVPQANCWCELSRKMRSTQILLFFSRPNENYFMIILRVVVTMCKGMSSGMNETRRKLSETGI